MKILRFAICALIAALSSSSAAFAQNGNITGITFSSTGRPAGGVNVAICSTLVTTAAAVANNVATLTFASNPQTQGFVNGQALTVYAFTGADTYFNGAFIISSTSATTISYALVHANASAGSNGTVYQTGTIVQACAPLATLYTDNTGNFTTPNPFVSDGLGNYTAWAMPGYYHVQTYGTNFGLSIYAAGVACVPGASVNCVGSFSGAVANGQVAYGVGADVFGSDATFTMNAATHALGVGGNVTLTQQTAATGGANQSSPSLNFIANYWTGAVSAADTFTCSDILGVGANPSASLTCTHTGSATAPFVDLSTFPVKVAALYIVSGAVVNVLESGGSAGNAIQLPPANPAFANMFVAAQSGNPVNWIYRNAPWSASEQDFTAQTAAIGATPLASPPLFAGATQYRISWNAKVTTPGSVSSTLGPLTITYVDPDGTTQTITAGALSKAGAIETSDAGNITTTVLLGVPIMVNANNASNSITYAFGYAANAGASMAYNLHIRIEAVQ